MAEVKKNPKKSMVKCLLKIDHSLKSTYSTASAEVFKAVVQQVSMPNMLRMVKQLFVIWVMIFFWLKFLSACISSELAWTCILCQGKMNVENNACKSRRAVMKKKSEILYFRSNKTTWLGRVGGWGFKTSRIWIQCKFQIHHWLCWLCDRKQHCPLPKGKGQIGNFHTRQKAGESIVYAAHLLN